jgi:hypothetical protein
MKQRGIAMPLLRKLSVDERRSVRHWAMEFVVVVVGVLLALWLQEWMQRRQAVQDMHAAEVAIHGEVRSALESLIWRQAISKCHFDRAERLKSMLLKSGSQWPGINEDALLQNSLEEATGVQTVVPSVYPRPTDAFMAVAWNSALTTGALTPMDPQRFAKLTQIYAQIQFLSANFERENRAATSVSALAFPQELAPETRTRMLEALYELDSSRFVFNFRGASELAGLMRQLGWNDKSAIDEWIAEDRAADKKQGFRWRPCVQGEKNPFAAIK